MQKWANASCKSTLSLWVITMHNQKYSQPRFTCKQQWLHSIFIIKRWKFHKRTVNNCSQPINYILWWIYFLLKGCNVAYKSEIDLRSTRSRLNYLKLWLIFSGCKWFKVLHFMKSGWKVYRKDKHCRWVLTRQQWVLDFTFA